MRHTGCSLSLTVLCFVVARAGTLVSAQTAKLKEDGGSIANTQITAEWQARGNHPGRLLVRGGLSSITLDAPFAILINKRGTLRASDLTPVSAPTTDGLKPVMDASQYSDRIPGVAVHYRLADPEGGFRGDWSLILREGSSYVRESLTITAGDKPVAITNIRMIDVHAPGIAVAGTVHGSPLVIPGEKADFYLGFEQPLSESSVVDDHGVSELPVAVPLGAHHAVTYTAVIGIARKGQLRRDFLAYIERERAHPYRTFLHYNSWFDIGFFTPYSQQDALTRIHQIGEELHKKRGVVLDSYLFDDGWDDHNDLWHIRSDFERWIRTVESSCFRIQRRTRNLALAVGRLRQAEG